MTAKFIMVRYGKYSYKGVQPKLEEVPGHFDVKRIKPKTEYSLHTEYAYYRRKFNNPIFDELSILKESSYNGIPLLWSNKDWSEQFFQFVNHIVGKNKAPKIIEIHPPFKSYCHRIDDFLEVYSVFEELVSEKYPETTIAIENRTGSEYKSDFLVSNASDIAELMRRVKESDYKLKLMLDIPQLFSAMGGVKKLDMAKLRSAFQTFEEYKERIVGIHIYGNDPRPHLGDLDSLFKSPKLKEEFLGFLSEYFDDNIPRYLVPEVNFSSQEVFDSVVDDLLRHFEFL